MPRSPLRRRMTGVCIALALTITASLAITRSCATGRRVTGSSSTPSTPTARPHSMSTRSTRASVRSLAPSRWALGMYETSMLWRASPGQPWRQRALPLQRAALRVIGWPGRPSTRQASAMRSELPPKSAVLVSVTSSSRSIWSKASSRARRSTRCERPCCAIHSSRTSSGKRQMMPELMAVAPPTQRPWSIGSGVEPRVVEVAKSRNAIAMASSTSAGLSAVRSCGPSSSISTSRPAPASTLAAVAPPAPVPTMTKSATSSTTRITRPPATGPSAPGARRGP